MKDIFCAPFHSKNNKYTFEILKELQIEDIVWMENLDFPKAKHIQVLINSSNSQFKIIKVTENKLNCLYFLFEILPISINEINQNDLSFINKIGLKLLKCYKFNLAHPSFSVLYDFDFCISDTSKVTENQKIELIAETIDTISSTLDVSIVTYPIQSEISIHTQNILMSFTNSQQKKGWPT